MYQIPAMADKSPSLFVVSASLTDDGSPPYMRADGSWSPKLSEASAVDDDALKPMLEAALTEERKVCDPYGVRVRLDGGTPVAVSAREEIRATGPTTRVRRPDPTGDVSTSS